MLDDVLGLYLAGEVNAVFEIEATHQSRGVGVFARRADHCEPQCRPPALELGHGVQEVRKPFQRRVGRQGGHDSVFVGWRAVQGAKGCQVDAVAHVAHTRAVKLEVVGDVFGGCVRDREDAVHVARDFHLHGKKTVPAVHAQALHGGPGGFQSYVQVAGDGVVDGGDHRCVALELEQAWAQALVVMDDVIVVFHPVGVKAARYTLREGQHFGETAGHRFVVLGTVDGVAPLFSRGQAKASLLACPKVHAGNFFQAYAFHQLGVGLAAPDVDLVAHVDQLAAEQAHVYALAPRSRVASISKHGDAQGCA